MKRRDTNRIFVHCSATPEGREVSVAEITKWHQDRGFKTIGYHYVIHLDGTVEHGRSDDEVGAHVRGFNLTSIGICLVGGVSADDKRLAKNTYTPAQMASLEALIKSLLVKYPKIKGVLGHRDVEPNKACPCFNVQKWMKGWGT